MIVDLVIIFAYLLLLLLVSIYHRSTISSFASYSNVSSSFVVGKLLLVATIFASSVGAGTIFGITEKVFIGDLSYTYALLIVLPIDIIIGFYIVPRISKYYGAQTVGDIMFHYYGLVGRFIAGAATIVVCIGFISMQISVGAYIFEYILKVNWVTGLIVSYGIIIIYTTIGGLNSIIFSNLLQFCVVIIAVPLITIFGINEIGISEFIDKIPMDIIVPTSDNNLCRNVMVATLSFLVMNLYPTLIQRTLINRTSLDTTKAIYIKSGIFFIFLILVTLNGIIAHELYPDAKSNFALPNLINSIIPVGARGFVIAGLLAAVMSTADADLNVTSSTMVKDFFIPIFKIENHKNLLSISRVTNILIGGFSIILALKFNNIIDILVFITGFWGPIIVVPLVFALFDITVSKKFLILSAASGCVSFILWEVYCVELFYVRGVFVGTLVNLIIFLIGIFTKNCRKLYS